MVRLLLRPASKLDLPSGSGRWPQQLFKAAASKPVLAALVDWSRRARRPYSESARIGQTHGTTHREIFLRVVMLRGG
jgi:hypothetical protein